MGEAKRRMRDKGRGKTMKLDDAISQFADSVLNGGGDDPAVVIGPLVWNIAEGHDRKYWYFNVGSADAAGQFRVDQLKVAQDDKSLAEETRTALMLAFIDRRPVTVHDFDDELRMIRFCEAKWPLRQDPSPACGRGTGARYSGIKNTRDSHANHHQSAPKPHGTLASPRVPAMCRYVITT